MWTSSGLLSSLALATLAAVQGAGASPTPLNFPVNPGAGLDVRMEPASGNVLYGRHAPMSGLHLSTGPQCAGSLEVCSGKKNITDAISPKRDVDEKIPAGSPMPRGSAHNPVCKTPGACPGGDKTSPFENFKRELAAAIARAEPAAARLFKGKLDLKCGGCSSTPPPSWIPSLVPILG